MSSWREVYEVKEIGYQVYRIHCVFNNKPIFWVNFKTRREAEAHAASWFWQNNKEIEGVLLS